MRRITSIVAVALLAAASAARAGEVVVVASGPAAPGSEVVCAMFAGARGFPMEMTSARLQRAVGWTCRYADVKPGTYAVAVAELPKGQANVDRDFLGRPLQPWGVSNNARPMLRAPSFAEAAFAVPAVGEALLSVALSK